jgi:hypothetical protein
MCGVRRDGTWDDEQNKDDDHNKMHMYELPQSAGHLQTHAAAEIPKAWGDYVC